jgi:hypothetical protein
MRRGERLLAGFLLAIALAGGGCTTQAWYEATKVGARNECRRQPSGDSETCLSRVNPLTYEDYERQRSGRKPQHPGSGGE